VKAINIKAFLLTAALAALASAPSTSRAGTLFTTPIINVSPRTIDFGVVPVKTTVTNTFLIENWGGGKLVGKATVPRPFKIISGGAYRLGPSDAQVITITYTPSGALLDTNVVKFTGGAGLLAPVIGKTLSTPDYSTQK
jgi:hypothetical protein